VDVVEEDMTMIDILTDSDSWANWWQVVQSWSRDQLASTDTLIELGLIGLAAGLAWPLSIRLRKTIGKLGQRHARYAILGRLWLTLAKIAFPILWVAIQWIFVLVMSELGMRHAAIVVVSSLLTAWIGISIVTVFVVNPLWSTIIAVSAWIVAALNILGLLDNTAALLDGASFSLGQLNISALTIVKGVIALGVLLWVTALAGQVIEGRIKASTNLTPSIQVLATKLMRIGLAVVAFIFAISIVGIDLTAFAVLGGAIGVGLGFGLQKIFANLVSGFILLLDKSIKPGDVIAIANDYGRVDSLGARYVSVLTRDGIEHLIPNEELITTRVENWSYSQDLLRLRKTIGIHYKSDVRKAMDLCLQAADEIPRILKDPEPVCYVQDFADSSVNLEVRFWINDPVNGRANVIGPLLLNVWDKFHEHGIEIPYPQRDLHLRSSDLPPADGTTLPGHTPAHEAAA
jgi:small-conductance mechanosensitive channel